MYTIYGDLCTEVYDISKPLGYSTGDVEYYFDRLKDIKGKILELGCGSGRVLIPLLQEGLDVDGLDNAQSMLNSCRRRCEALGLSPLLIQAEMHAFTATTPYDAIIIPGGSFQLIEGRTAAIHTLQHIYAHLVENGIFMLDLFIPTNFSTTYHSTKTYESSSQDIIILDEKRVEVNWIEQKIISLLKYEKWSSGALIQSELQRLPLSWYGVYEFISILENVGFKQIVLSADYMYENKPTHQGQMMTFEMRK